MAVREHINDAEDHHADRCHDYGDNEENRGPNQELIEGAVALLGCDHHSLSPTVLAKDEPSVDGLEASSKEDEVEHRSTIARAWRAATAPAKGVSAVGFAIALPEKLPAPGRAPWTLRHKVLHQPVGGGATRAGGDCVLRRRSCRHALLARAASPLERGDRLSSMGDPDYVRDHVRCRIAAALDRTNGGKSGKSGFRALLSSVRDYIRSRFRWSGRDLGVLAHA